MKMPKKYPRKQLEKFSGVFMQLGLVLVLFTVYITLEYESAIEQTPIAINEGVPIEETFDYNKPFILVKKIEKVKEKVVKKEKRVKDLTNISKTDEGDVTETVIDLPNKENTTPLIDTDAFKEAYEDDLDTKDDPNPVSINNVQNVPVFRGCEGLGEEASRICFEKKMQKHVKRYFNSEIAQDAGLRSGKYRIYTQFVIDKTGKVVDIKIRAPHKRLEKEVNRVITKIPQFTPGKQNNKPVKVKYILPISFKVE